MSFLEGAAEGVMLAVKAQPNARQNRIVGPVAVAKGVALKIAVSAPPEDGKANAAIVELLRELLGCGKSRIKLVSGATSREKRFLLREFTIEEMLPLFAKYTNEPEA